MGWHPIWCNLKAGENHLAFCCNFDAYLKHLQDQGLIEEHRLMR